MKPSIIIDGKVILDKGGYYSMNEIYWAIRKVGKKDIITPRLFFCELMESPQFVLELIMNEDIQIGTGLKDLNVKYCIAVVYTRMAYPQYDKWVQAHYGLN